MNKSKIILATTLGFIVMATLLYIAFKNYDQESLGNQLTQTDNPIISGDPTTKELVGPNWSWERLVVSIDEIVFPRVPDAYTITFDKEGKMSGTTDCNSFSGNYSLDKNNISFSDIASTKMYCQDSKEDVFKNSLAKTENYFFDNDGKLVLETASSSIIFVDKNSEQNKNNWDLIKEAVADCNIKDGGQTHSRKVTVTLKNGDKLEAYSPQIDNIFDIVKDSEEKCGKVMLWTE